MKKYLFLTSVFTLTACGGGSGGNIPGETNTPYVDSIRQSNSAITSMVSNSEYQATRYVTNKLGADASSVNLSRGAFVPQPSSGNIDYDTARELVDLAAWLANDTTSEQDIISKFNESGADKNKIKAALKLMDDMYCFVGGSAEETAERIVSHRANFQNSLADLQQKTEVFDLEKVEFIMASASGGGGDEGGSKDLLTFKLDDQGYGKIVAVNHVAMVNNGEGLEISPEESATFTRNDDKNNSFNVGQINGEGKTYTGNGVIITYGETVGLRYSDFGQLKYDLHWTSDYDSGDEKSFEPFAGGYKDLRQEAPTNNMRFTGKAAGSVSNDDFDKNIIGDATLIFDNGKETLHMNFSNTTPNDEDTPWYNVTIVRNKLNSAENSIKFATNDELNAKIPDNLKFDSFDNNNIHSPSEYNIVDGYNGTGYGHIKHPDKGDSKIDIGYYGGRDGKITEATGVTQYVEPLQNNGEIRMNVGFGMKKE